MRPHRVERHAQRLPRTDPHGGRHSARNATTGSIPAALFAGYQPEIIPTALETNTDSTTYGTVTFSVVPNAADSPAATIDPNATPINPPAIESSTDSVRNCSMISM